MPVAEQGTQPARFGGAERIFRVHTVKVDTETATKVEIATINRGVISTDIEESWLGRVTKPVWATAFGRDVFGLFADFQLPADASSAAVRQRLRWIPPGRFQMGSPAGEPGRDKGEVLHEVTISYGYWMFDTPCTQQLWQALMGENPSRFPDPQRPVEQVSWDQANEFASKLTEQFRGLRFSLPTEAQWEYACRAGTTTAVYSGRIEILGSANAPTLDPIAWYGGNSGHEFDHEQPEDISDWKWLEEKQYDFSVAGTRRAKQKRPSPWGLYDMLGNVWEWCRDWHAAYEPEPQVDPRGPDEGSARVVRGGSWSYDARHVRSACRDWYPPSARARDLIVPHNPRMHC